MEEDYNVDYLVIKITLENKIFAIGVIYRPPNGHYTNICVLADIINYLSENNICNFILLSD